MVRKSRRSAPAQHAVAVIEPRKHWSNQNGKPNADPKLDVMSRNENSILLPVGQTTYLWNTLDTVLAHNFGKWPAGVTRSIIRNRATKLVLINGLASVANQNWSEKHNWKGAEYRFVDYSHSESNLASRATSEQTRINQNILRLLCSCAPRSSWEVTTEPSPVTETSLVALCIWNGGSHQNRCSLT